MIAKRVFSFWTGYNEMSENRRACLATITRSGLELVLITPNNLSDWILPDHPLHASFEHLSLVHKSDYLRAYFMHHHGGGYSDIKHTTGSWIQSWDEISNNNNLDVIGYPEVSPKGIARFHKNKLLGTPVYLGESTGNTINTIRYYWLRNKWPQLIGMGAFIFRNGTKLTQEWLSHVETRLTWLEPHLRKAPAISPREVCANNGNTITGYSVPWTFLLGDVLHPLLWKHRKRVSQSLPAPSFTNYL
ncbi:capsular polysaccharide synthesis protein [Pseudovibrio exalbescens]|uniref:capsular polysaccharide synthesis protein n=1 Tax=Pseudovibrio exalbescens TaxID=197461 RepID=UPI0011AF9A27